LPPAIPVRFFFSFDHRIRMVRPGVTFNQLNLPVICTGYAYQRQPECKQQPTVQHPLVPKKHWCALQPPTCSFYPAEPDYPEALYLLMSVRAGKFTHAAAFG
jgi:hypothetical protein